jgi:hypothetical protein
MLGLLAQVLVRPGGQLQPLLGSKAPVAFADDARSGQRGPRCSALISEKSATMISGGSHHWHSHR